MPTVDDRDPPTLAVLCRGSITHGLGHIGRSAALVQALRRVEATAQMLVVGDEAARGMVRDIGIDATVVADEAAAVGAIALARPNVVVFDTVAVEDSTFDQLRRYAGTASISPVFSHQRQVDSSFSRTTHEPDPLLAADSGRHRRGIDYLILGDHVRPVSHAAYASRLYGSPLSVGLSMGGADAPNRTLEVLQMLRALEEPLLIWAMLGEGYQHSYDDLAEAIRRDSRHEIILARTSRSMWTVLRQTNVLILAGGVTTYEAARAGLPSINLLTIPDHRFLLRELEDRGATTTLTVDDSTGRDLRASLTKYDEDRDLLFLMHRACSGIVDGRGADRVAAALIEQARAAS